MSGSLAVVTGASGFVGSHIVDELLRSGASVRCLLRSTSSTRWLDGKPVEIVRVSMNDAGSLAESLRGARWIVHAAGLTHARSAREFHDVNVGGTEHMLRAAMSAGPDLERFLLVSSQAAAGPSGDGKPVVEAERSEPVSTYGTTKLRSERLALLLRDRIPVTVIRPPAVYGPRDEAFLKYFAAVKHHLLPMLKPGGRFSLVYVEDLARAIGLALQHPDAKGKVYFAAEPEQTDYAEFGRCVVQAMGVKAMALTPPGWLLQAGALGGELWGMILRRPPLLSREKIKEITAGDWICSSAKIRAELKWAPEVPLQEGIRRTAAWYREVGWV
jgi:nucleoside-diphosphate-sugar epimerase